MPGKYCSDKRCDAGRKSSTYVGSYFGIRSEWVQSLPTADWNLSGVLCERHFYPSQIVTEKRDSKDKRSLERGALTKKFVKDNEVPKIWPGWPEYHTKSLAIERSDVTSAEVRIMNEAARERELDRVSSLDQIKSKLASFPKDVTLISNDSSVHIMMIELTTVPKIKFCISINDDLTFRLSFGGAPFPIRYIQNITTKPNIEYASEILALINFLANYNEKGQITYAPETITSLLEEALDFHESDTERAKKIQFFLEQWTLLFKPRKGRRYSNETIAQAVIWYKTSPNLYKQILASGVVSLPSVRHVRRLSSALTVDLELTESTIVYLKARFAKLNEREKNIATVLDEVITNQRAEYVGGNFFGVNGSGVTKKLLGIMIKSVGGKFCDMVAMQPVVTCDSEMMKKIFMNVLKAITEIGFSTCAVVVDGNRLNMKFYRQELYGGTMGSAIINPFKTEDKIFPVFDSVHIFKCLYNIFLNKNELKIPAFGEFRELNPVFQHIVRVYELELGKPVKYAHKLTDKNIASKPIERCNVKLADAIFHESTINALTVYSKDYPDFLHTAEYLKIVRKWWNIMNTDSESLGKAKRDVDRNAVSLEDSHVSVYLRSFAGWLQNWQTNGEKAYSLTNETFTTAIHTSRNMPELANHLLTERKDDFKFVLYRHIQQDCIEGRFGRGRQMHGGDYYAASRQFLVAEKTIRLTNLLKFNDLNMADIKEMFSATNLAVEKKIDQDVATLRAQMKTDFRLETITDDDNAILFYVAGYNARSLKKSTKCQSCWKLLVKDENVPVINVDDVENQSKYKCFFNTINRGGLCNPADTLHMATVHAYEYFSVIFNNNEWKSLLMSSQNPRAVFVNSFAEMMKDSEHITSLSSQICSKNHSFLKFVKSCAFKMFNICSKNHVNEINNKVHAARKRKGSDKNKPQSQNFRKILKVQSASI